MEIHELVTDSRSLLNTHYTNGDAFQCIRERWSLTRSANCNRVFKTSVRTLYRGGEKLPQGCYYWGR